MSSAPTWLKLDWLYEGIADPDSHEWSCLTCGHRNPHAYGLKECEQCGFELDQDRIRDALTKREAEGENSALQMD